MSRKYKFHNPEGLYFVSFAVVNWIDVFTRRVYQDLAVDSLKYCQENKGMQLYAWCIMTNHLHLIFSAREGFVLPDILRDMKKFTSGQLLRTIAKNKKEGRKEWMFDAFRAAGEYKAQNRRYQFWRQDNQPIVLYTNKVIDQKVNYIHANPVKAGFVDSAEKYRLSSAIDYAGGKGLLDVIIL